MKSETSNNWKPSEGELRRIQISPMPDESGDDTEQAIVYQSPTFRFADTAGRIFGSGSPPPPSGSVPFHVMEGGRPVKAEVKLMVKTADVGKQAVEIRSIREFVDMPSGQPHGPFSRIFSSCSPPPPASGSTSPSFSRPSPSSSSSVSPASTPSMSPKTPDRRFKKSRALPVLKPASPTPPPSPQPVVGKKAIRSKRYRAAERTECST